MHDFVLDISSVCTVSAEDFLNHRLLSLSICCIEHYTLQHL